MPKTLMTFSWNTLFVYLCIRSHECRLSYRTLNKTNIFATVLLSLAIIEVFVLCMQSMKYQSQHVFCIFRCDQNIMANDEAEGRRTLLQISYKYLSNMINQAIDNDIECRMMSYY